MISLTSKNFQSFSLCEGDWIDRPTIDASDYQIQASRVRANPDNLADSAAKFLATVCPSQVTHYTCYYHTNKTQAEILERRNWIPRPTNNTADTCIPFRPSEFLELMRGRKLFLVGDSVMAGIFTTFLCSLHTITETIKFQMTFKRLPTCTQLMCPDRNSGEHAWNRGGHFYFRFYDFHLVYHVEDIFTDNIKNIINRHNTQSTDVILYNVGLHYHDETIYETKLQSWRIMMETIFNHTKRIPHILYLESSPQHFSHKSNGYHTEGIKYIEDAHCQSLYDPTIPGDLQRLKALDWRNTVLHRVLQPMVDMDQLRIIPIAEDLYSQHDAHVERSSPEYTTPTYMDCTHWCFPGNVDRYLQLKIYNMLIRRIEDIERNTTYYSKVLSKHRISVSNVTTFTQYAVFKHYGILPGEVFRFINDRSIYMMTADGIGRPFNSWNAFVAYGYSINQVKSFSKDDSVPIPIGDPLPPPNK